MTRRRRKPAPASSLLANLAATPFINRRPVQRFIAAAWVTGVLLAGVNVLLWVQYRHESTTLRARLASTRDAADAKSKSVVKMNEELQGLRLPAQNAQVAFLNQRIAERTFPWSLLFERIAATLPDGVRLSGLTPVFSDRSEGPAAKSKEPAASPGEELVNLKIRGAAKNDEALYQLIDGFFASPAFVSPRLYQENSSGLEVEFTVDVDYRPRFVPEPSHQPVAAALEAGVDDEQASVQRPVEHDGGASAARPREADGAAPPVEVSE